MELISVLKQQKLEKPAYQFEENGFIDSPHHLNRQSESDRIKTLLSLILLCIHRSPQKPEMRRSQA